MIEPVDLGVCAGVEWGRGRDRTAIVLPGAMLGGMPSTYYAALTLFEDGYDVLELDGADHGLAKLEHLPPLLKAIRRFAA